MTGTDSTQEIDSAGAQGVAGVPVSGLATEPKTEAPTIEATVIGPDPVWPDWNLISVVCSSCGATNQIHEQTPEALAAVHPVGGNRVGVVWECNACSAKNNLGGEAPVKPDLYVLECGTCHSTFAPSQTTMAADGTWTCRVCDTENRDVHSHDTGTGATTASAVTVPAPTTPEG